MGTAAVGMSRGPSQDTPGTRFWRIRYNSWWKHAVTAVLPSQGLGCSWRREWRCLGGQFCASSSEGVHLPCILLLYSLDQADKYGAKWEVHLPGFKKERGETAFPLRSGSQTSDLPVGSAKGRSSGSVVGLQPGSVSDGPIYFVSKTHFYKENLRVNAEPLSRSRFQPWVTRVFPPVTPSPLSRGNKTAPWRGQDRRRDLISLRGSGCEASHLFSGNFTSCWMSGVTLIALILIFLLQGKLCCPYLVPVLFSTFFQFLLYLALQEDSWQAQAWLLNTRVMGLLSNLSLCSLQDRRVSLSNETTLRVKLASVWLEITSKPCWRCSGL